MSGAWISSAGGAIHAHMSRFCDRVSRFVHGPILASILDQVIAIGSHRSMSWRRFRQHHQAIIARQITDL
jgi:hypothetical protein